MDYRMTAYKDLEDIALLELVKEGDHNAYQELYYRYWRILYSHARKMLSNDEEVKDLIQDLFVTLWSKAADLNIQTSVAGYLYGMVRYKVFDLIDKQKVRNNHLQSLASFIENGEFTTDNTLRENELSRIIEQEVALLPSKMREVFELSRKANFSYKQIGARMDISDQTVKKQIFNALKILRLKLGSAYLLLVFLMQ